LGKQKTEIGTEDLFNKTEIGKTESCGESRNWESRKLWVKQKLGKQKTENGTEDLFNKTEIGKAESCG
jgi:hypothetical protein